MFAILLSEKMDPFYQAITSFPTAIWTFLIIFCVLYWAIAVFGLIDFDYFDFDFDLPEGDIDATDALSSTNVLAGLVMRLGLQGIPFPFTMSAISIFGWMISSFASLALIPYLPGGILYFLIGLILFMSTVYIAAILTSLVLKPLKPVFKAADQEVEKNIVGQMAIIRTARADNKFGEATVEDGGAGLIVKVRAYESETYKRGDRVVLLEYISEEHVYRVISETEFNK